jgi:hypothetical protein
VENCVTTLALCLVLFVAIVGLGALGTVATGLMSREIALLDLPHALFFGAFAVLVGTFAVAVLGVFLATFAALSPIAALIRGLLMIRRIPEMRSRRRASRPTEHERLGQPLRLAIFLLPLSDARGYWHEWHGQLDELCSEGRYKEARRERRAQLVGAAKLAMMLRIGGRLRRTEGGS